MSVRKPGSQAPRTARRPPVSGQVVRPARRARAGGPRHRRRAVWLAVVSAGTVLLATACGGSAGPAASPGHTLYARELSYSRCMRAHGVPDFPILKQGPGGSLVHPVSPPAGMLTAPGYDAAFRACLGLAVVGGSRARYRAAALKGLAQSECMRAHGITGYPSPGALDGGLHEPDATAIGLDTHTLRFRAAARACGMADGLWQAQWWWPAGLSQP